MNEEEWWSTYVPVLDEHGDEADLGPPAPCRMSEKGKWANRPYRRGNGAAMIALHKSEYGSRTPLGYQLAGCFFLFVYRVIPALFVILVVVGILWILIGR